MSAIRDEHMIKGFHHPAIVVPDLEKAREFYEEVLGFALVEEFSWDSPSPVHDQITGLENSAARAYLMKCNNAYLELFQYVSPLSQNEVCRPSCANEPGIRHLAFEVDDAQVEYERFKLAGGITMNPPYIFPEGGSAVYCCDPFGNIIEFTTAGRGFPSIDDL